ncbi:tRNA pseudouridine(38-40) synthase TruA [Bacteroidia bacterium]|nr:tRNA pseudouridine(38-40) synthase TruA [Bacteroidia bacterium]
MRYVLEIAYNGTNYHGWQMQPNNITVQETLEKELSKILKSETAIMGCGRTDTGVHATQFFLHFDYDELLPERFIFRLNQMLPKDIAIKRAFEVNNQFHSRFSATYRSYIYKASMIKDPFQENQMLFLYNIPDISLMNDGCKELLRHTDFASFCKRGGDNKTTVCDLTEAKWTEKDGMVEFYVKSNRFLRNMVRALVGTLLEVGYGNISLNELKKIINDRERSSAGKSVSPVGLYLVEVGYNWNEHKI